MEIAATILNTIASDRTGHVFRQEFTSRSLVTDWGLTAPSSGPMREVILSAGAIGSPHILQLSGVGSSEHLGRMGVPVVHQLRGHYVARVSYPVVGAPTANERSRGLPLAGEVMRWLFTGKGILTYSPSIVAASAEVL